MRQPLQIPELKNSLKQLVEEHHATKIRAKCSGVVTMLLGIGTTVCAMGLGLKWLPRTDPFYQDPSSIALACTSSFFTIGFISMCYLKNRETSINRKIRRTKDTLIAEYTEVIFDQNGGNRLPLEERAGARITAAQQAAEYVKEFYDRTRQREFDPEKASAERMSRNEQYNIALFNPPLLEEKHRPLLQASNQPIAPSLT